MEEIKEKTEELNQEFYKISEKLYQNANSDEAGSGGSAPEDDVVEGDYEVVDED